MVLFNLKSLYIRGFTIQFIYYLLMVVLTCFFDNLFNRSYTIKDKNLNKIPSSNFNLIFNTSSKIYSNKFLLKLTFKKHCLIGFDYLPAFFHLNKHFYYLSSKRINSPLYASTHILYKLKYFFMKFKNLFFYLFRKNGLMVNDDAVGLIGLRLFLFNFSILHRLSYKSTV